MLSEKLYHSGFFNISRCHAFPTFLYRNCASSYPFQQDFQRPEQFLTGTSPSGGGLVPTEELLKAPPRIFSRFSQEKSVADISDLHLLWGAHAQFRCGSVAVQTAPTDGSPAPIQQQLGRHRGSRKAVMSFDPHAGHTLLFTAMAAASVSVLAALSHRPSRAYAVLGN